MKLVLATAATDRPVTTDKAADWLEETDPARFAKISALVDSAVAQLEREHWTQFCTATWEQHFDRWPSSAFLLRKNPVGAVASVKYYDADGTLQTLASTVWEQADWHGRGIVRLAYDQQWPSDLRGHADDIVISYTAGYGDPADVPEPIKHAIRVWIASAYAVREEFSTLRLNRAPQTVESLMAAYSYRTIG